MPFLSLFLTGEMLGFVPSLKASSSSFLEFVVSVLEILDVFCSEFFFSETLFNL